MGRAKCGAPAPGKHRRCCFQPHVLHRGVAMGLVPMVLCLAMGSPAGQFTTALGSPGLAALGTKEGRRGTRHAPSSTGAASLLARNWWHVPAR